MIWLYSLLGRFVLFALCRSARVEEVNAEFTREYVLDKKKNVIIAFWHNRLSFMTYHLATQHVRRGHKLVLLSSRSKDGELIARVAAKLGSAVVRGSSSKGGIEGLINLYRKAQEGYSPVIAPDGPRGPKYEVQDGLLFLAQKTGYPIIPVSWSASRFRRFRSWDGFLLPKLFAKVKLVYGEPIFATEETPKEELRARIKNSLMKITED